LTLAGWQAKTLPIMPHSPEIWAEVFVQLLPTEQGGREQPLSLSNNSPGQYRPHFRMIDGSGELLGVAFMDGPDEPILPGQSTYATVELLYPGVSYDELLEGARFEILEGPNIVGHGTVTRR
jgi:translation elongation factor EF-Tu-like GTPase